MDMIQIVATYFLKDLLMLKIACSKHILGRNIFENWLDKLVENDSGQNFYQRVKTCIPGFATRFV